MSADESPESYYHRVSTAVTKAIFEASLTEIDGKPTAFIRTTEACEALITVMGMLMEGAPPCQTPQGMRKMAEAVGKNTLAAMKASRERREASGVGLLGSSVVLN